MVQALPGHRWDTAVGHGASLLLGEHAALPVWTWLRCLQKPSPEEYR